MSAPPAVVGASGAARREGAVRVVRRAIGRNPPLNKAFHHLRLRLAARSRREVLVYSVGKVGSSTVCAALAARAPDLRVHHLHWLTPEALERDERAHAALARTLPADQAPLPTYVWRGQYVRRRIDRGRSGDERWQVVTLVRDPVARDISSFFQNLAFVGFDHRAELRRRPLVEVADELVDRFVASYVHGRPTTWIDGDPLTWFDDELLAVFGVDVFASPFSPSVGYEILHGDGADVLVLRLEDLDRVAAEAFHRFLGVDGVAVPQRNTAASKDYAALYERFTQQLELPADHLDRVYRSRLLRHFYSTEEIERFRRRWGGS